VLTDWPSREVVENTVPTDEPCHRMKSDGYDARRSGMRLEVHRARPQEDREIGLLPGRADDLAQERARKRRPPTRSSRS